MIFQNLETVHSSFFINNKKFLPKGRSFTANSGTKAAVLPKGSRFSTAKSGKRLQFYQGLNRCGSFPLLSSLLSLSLASEQTVEDLKRPQGHQDGGEESGFG